MYFTLFEKIFFTLGIINAIMLIVGSVINFVWDKAWSMFLILPLYIQFVVFLVMLIVVEVILCGIWGLDLHVFPSLFKE